MNQEAQFLIKKLDLVPHEEGGYFRVTYESKQQIEIPGYNGKRRIGNAIYYLMTGDKVNPFHRLKSDELWHFYSGSPFTLYTIDPNGKLSKIPMGQDIRAGQTVQAVMESGTWFGGELDDPNSYCLIGCTVGPGFDLLDFEIGNRDILLKQYPEHKSVIERIARE